MKDGMPLELCYTTALLRKFPISSMSAYNLRTLKLLFPPKNQTIQANNNLYDKLFSCQSPLYKEEKQNPNQIFLKSPKTKPASFI